jgi:threonine dehydrogenase-like Zn-dependent dehydrogenase
MKVQVEHVPDPKILNPRDAIVQISATCICGSDLHLYGGFVPTMRDGDILGHEFMGRVVDVGRDVTQVRKGDRVLVPFAIACGACWYCKQGLWSCCDNTNPNATMANRLYNYSGSALFGYSHLYGGYAGGQAEAARVPFADVNCFKIPDGLSDEQAVLLTDILPTAYQAAENCNIHPGDVVAVWGCGPIGLLALKCALLLGADRVIAIDRFPDRLERASRECRAEIINYQYEDVQDRLKELTGGRGPDACIDAVGMEAHTGRLVGTADWLKQKMMLESDRPHVLRQAMMACRKGGTVSIPGVYTGLIDHIPFGAAFAKSLTLRMGQTHVHRYVRPLIERIQKGDIDPTFIVSHRIRLDDATPAYAMFQKKRDGCVKVVMKP